MRLFNHTRRTAPPFGAGRTLKRRMEAKALATAEDVICVSALDEFRLALLRELIREVPPDWASLNDLGPDPRDAAVLLMPEPPPGLLPAYVAPRGENQIRAYIERTQDGRATRFSNHATREEPTRAPAVPAGLDEVAFLLGHSNANVTRAVYVHEVADTRRRAMRRSRMLAEYATALAACTSATTLAHTTRG
jgi:integrase